MSSNSPIAIIITVVGLIAVYCILNLSSKMINCTVATLKVSWVKSIYYYIPETLQWRITGAYSLTAHVPKVSISREVRIKGSCV